MKYRQGKIADESVMATRAKLKIEGEWIDGIILDKNGKALPFPFEVKGGETYIIEVTLDKKK